MVFCFKTGVKKKKFYPKLFNYYYNNVLSEKEADEHRNEIVSKSFDLAPILVQGWKSFALKSEDLRTIVSEVECPTLVTYAMKDKKVQYNRNIDGIKKFKDLKLLKYQVGHTPILESSKQFLDDLLLFIQQKRQKALSTLLAKNINYYFILYISCFLLDLQKLVTIFL